MKAVEYLTEGGDRPFGAWFRDLNAPAAAKVTIAVTRLEQGNTSNVESVDRGVYEYKIDFGPGYRVYFGQDGERIVVLVAGGTKKRQSRDIQTAKARWQDYKRRKKIGG